MNCLTAHPTHPPTSSLRGSLTPVQEGCTQRASVQMKGPPCSWGEGPRAGATNDSRHRTCWQAEVLPSVRTGSLWVPVWCGSHRQQAHSSLCFFNLAAKTPNFWSFGDRELQAGVNQSKSNLETVLTFFRSLERGQTLISSTDFFLSFMSIDFTNDK